MDFICLFIEGSGDSVTLWRCPSFPISTRLPRNTVRCDQSKVRRKRERGGGVIRKSKPLALWLGLHPLDLPTHAHLSPWPALAAPFLLFSWIWTWALGSRNAITNCILLHRFQRPVFIKCFIRNSVKQERLSCCLSLNSWEVCIFMLQKDHP